MFNLLIFLVFLYRVQPPSGGCVLKHGTWCIKALLLQAATFGWLCVETPDVHVIEFADGQPPSGGCVLKLTQKNALQQLEEAATFGWLCVETLTKGVMAAQFVSSRLRAAVC